MARTFLFGTCLMLAAAIGACALFQESPEQRAKRIEPMLSAAGFHMIPADNDQKVSAIQPLPPLRMRYYAKNGKLTSSQAIPAAVRYSHQRASEVA